MVSVLVGVLGCLDAKVSHSKTNVDVLISTAT
jgi:hypothetical protein